MVAQTTRQSITVRFMPLPQDDPKQRQPNIERARTLLGGWEPKVPLAEGLQKTVSYFEKVVSDSQNKTAETLSV